MPNFEFDDTFLARWMAGELSEEEIKSLEQHPDYPVFKKIISAADQLAVPDAEVDAMWQKMQKNISESPKSKVKPLYIALLVAAIIGMLVVFVLRPTKQVPPPPTPMAFESGIGEQKEILLPDGSVVRLNALSKIHCDTSVWEANRLVYLEGEAWFDIRPQNGVPFSIATLLGSVTVLGTTFTVFQREQAFEVACFTGRVKSESRGKEITVTAGQKTAWQNDNWEAPKPLQSDMPDWIQGESRFENTRLRLVCDELERQYQVRISLSGDIADRLFSGAFVHHNLPLALRLICEPLGLTYSVNGQNIIIKD